MANNVFVNGREVSCKKADGKSICAFPDVCFTPPQTPATPPGVPVPYPNTGFAKDTTKGSKTVKISGKEVMLKNKSHFKKSTGDEAGRAPKKGLITSVNKGKVYFTSWSMNVKIEGKNVVRHLDMTTHNHGSLPGNSPPTVYVDKSTPMPVVQVHARLWLKSVIFSGGSDVDNDTFGNFPTPHFLAGRGGFCSLRYGDLPAQFPYAIPRATKLGATAVFEVTQQPTSSESVTVEAEATVNGTTLRFSGDVTVGPSDTEVATPRLESDVALPNTILKVDPLSLDWFQTPPDVSRRSAGWSNNTLYITLAAPTKSPLHWTLLEVSCTAASGETTVAGLRSKSYGALQKRNIKRARDDQPLTYWNPISATATNTQLLLAAPDGSGQCGSWAEFLIDMWKAHGDNGGHKVSVKHRSSDCVGYANSYINRDYILRILRSKGVSPSLRNSLIIRYEQLSKKLHDTIFFLVKNWHFDRPHPANPRTFHYEIGVKCVAQKGVAGQNNLDPPPDFCNHFIVSAGGKFYDPSYGSGPFRTKLAWENASIDGLRNGTHGGYRKSELSTTQLLKFH